MARFDWYQASVSAEVLDVRSCLSALSPCPIWEAQRPRQGYAFADALKRGDDTAAQIWWGGQHPVPHVVLSGEDAQAGAELLRAAWPLKHRVSRVDSCIDYAEPGAYERLQGLALGVARDERVKVDTRGDHLLTKKGRTVYLGASTSHTRLRIYDKAEQLRAQFAKDPVRLATVPAELARFECQVRPQTPMAKQIAAMADPLTVMGSSRWMRVLMGLVAGVELEPFQAGRPWRQSDDERAYAALLAQYGGLLKRMQGDLGEWDMVGRQIGHDLAEREAAKGARCG